MQVCSTELLVKKYITTLNDLAQPRNPNIITLAHQRIPNQSSKLGLIVKLVTFPAIDQSDIARAAKTRNNETFGAPP